MNRNEVQLVAANEELRATVRELEDRHSQLVIERDRLRMVLTAIASQSANPDIAAIAQTALSEGKEHG